MPLAEPSVASARGRLGRTALMWAPVLAYLAAIFYVSSLSRPPAVAEAASDKLLHGAAYALLAMLLVRALSGGRWAGVTWRVALASVALATLYGVTDEWHQTYVPGRMGDAWDLVADAAGAALGALACYLAGRVRRRRGVGPESSPQRRGVGG